MPSDDTHVDWIERGNEAYWRMNLDEAAHCFEKAVTTDPESARAHLCFGVACLFLYYNGLSDVDQKFCGLDSDGNPSDDEQAGDLDVLRDSTAEQNSTYGKRSEDHLQRAVQLDPLNKLAMEYLAALYYAWVDPVRDWLGNQRKSRLTDAQHWYKRIIAIDPEHPYANYVCGVIDWERAIGVMQSSGSYPLPLPSEEARRALHARIASLLEDSRGNLLRSLAIDGSNWSPMSYLSVVSGAQAYVAGTHEEYLQASREADEWKRRVNQVLEADAKASGREWPPDNTATITFHSVPGNPKPPPPFPPDPRHLIPLGLVPPPPLVQG